MKKVLFSLLSIFLFLLLAEVLVRVLLRPKDFEAWKRASIRFAQDGCFGWKMKPGLYLDKRGTILINGLGLRGEEVPLKKPAGEFRVLVLGGSAAFSPRAEGEKTWPRLLEMKLQGRLGPRVAVLNAGTPGYSAYQSQRRLGCDLLQLSPDLVLVYHLWNDVKYFWWDDIPGLIRHLESLGEFNERRTLMFLAREVPILDTLTHRSQLVARLRFALIKALLFYYHLHYEGPRHDALDKAVHPNGVHFYRENLLAIQRLLAERSIPLVIVKQASLVHPGNTSKERERIAYAVTGFPHEALVAALKRGWAVNDEICALEEVFCVPANEEIPRTLEYFRDHVHLKPKGLEALAEVVFRRVAGLIEKRLSTP